MPTTSCRLQAALDEARGAAADQVVERRVRVRASGRAADDRGPVAAGRPPPRRRTGSAGRPGSRRPGYGLRMIVAIVCSSSGSVFASAIVPLRGTPRKGVVPFGHAEAGSRDGRECDLPDRKRSRGALGLAPGHAQRRESHRAAGVRIDRRVHGAARRRRGAIRPQGRAAHGSRAGGWRRSPPRWPSRTPAISVSSRTRSASAIGSAHGGAETLHEAYETFYTRGFDRLSPFAIPLSLPNTAASAVARENNLHGPTTSIGTACAAGSDAIGAAMRLIRGGFAEAMVAGGAEAADDAVRDRRLPQARRAVAQRRRPGTRRRGRSTAAGTGS